MNEHVEKMKYPRSAIILLVCKYWERFCYSDFFFLIFVYLQDALECSEERSRMIRRIFRGMTYGFPLLGGIFADCWFGKYKTLIGALIVCIFGILIMTFISAITDHLTMEKIFAGTGIIILAIAIGVSRPCSVALGGDQFVVPQHQEHLTTFFYLFYVSVNLGRLTALMTWSQVVDFTCFRREKCYSFGFGIMAMAIAIAAFTLTISKSKFTLVVPQQNVTVNSIHCILYGFAKKFKAKDPVDHWLDRSSEKFGTRLVQETKENLNVTLVLLPLSFYLILRELREVRWQRQADQMDDLLNDSFTIATKAHLYMFQVAFSITFVLLWCYILLPLSHKHGLKVTYLRVMGTASIFAALSCYIAAVLSVHIETEKVTAPAPGQAHIRIYNPLNCTSKFHIPPYINGTELPPYGYKFFDVKIKGNILAKYEITRCNSVVSTGKNFALKERKSLAYYVTTNEFRTFQEFIKTREDGQAMIRTLIGNPTERTRLTYKSFQKFELWLTSYNSTSYIIQSGLYKLNNFHKVIKIRRGGIYRVLVFMKENDQEIEYFEVYKIKEDNEIHILWQIPQYILISLSESLIYPTTLAFVYTQAPVSMKTTLICMWYMTRPIGLLVYVLISHIYSFKKQSHELFFYATAVVIFTGVFIILAMKYKYVDRNEPPTSPELVEGTSD